MAKARVLIKGNVQGVGFRALLVQNARRFNIKGIARNLKDGTVEIFCDGSKKNIGAFLHKIDIKGEPEDPFSLHVATIEHYWEGQRGYKKAWKGYKDFEIDYGIKLNPYQKLTVEDMEYGKYYLSGTRSDVKETRTEIKAMHSEIKGMRLDIKGTHSEIKGMRSEMKESFGELATRYDGISRQLERLQEVPKELKLLRKAFERFLNSLAKEK